MVADETYNKMAAEILGLRRELSEAREELQRLARDRDRREESRELIELKDAVQRLNNESRDKEQQLAQANSRVEKMLAIMATSTELNKVRNEFFERFVAGLSSGSADPADLLRLYAQSEVVYDKLERQVASMDWG